MNPVEQVINNVVQMNSMRFPSEEDHVCKHCNRVVEKIEVEILGKRKLVQPVCKCEADAEAEDMKRFTEHQQRRDTEKLFSISSLGKRFEESSFETFIPREGAEMALKQAKKYAFAFDEYGPLSLLLWGTYGNGKSKLAAAVANCLKTNGKVVVFQSVPELLQRIRQTFNKNNDESEQQIMKALLTCDLLILDDIGAEKVTDWVSDALFRVIDGRYRKQLPTFYTSNLKLSELDEKLGSRIYDRILETTIPVQNKATSYRKEQAVERFEKLRQEMN
ncbi:MULTISPECIES: ATP-binding protein [Brevibacillus]|uniref:ATP-binding protein n=1 Tax=Brevibacillus TaxID=55080 RepID=UPI001F4C5718|nr:MULTISPECIES: ATP-binding protein [Brevibacillus]